MQSAILQALGRAFSWADIVEALINGEEPNGLSLAKLTQSFPEDWAEQRRQFGFVTD